MSQNIIDPTMISGSSDTSQNNLAPITNITGSSDTLQNNMMPESCNTSQNNLVTTMIDGSPSMTAGSFDMLQNNLILSMNVDSSSSYGLEENNLVETSNYMSQKDLNLTMAAGLSNMSNDNLIPTMINVGSSSGHALEEMQSNMYGNMVMEQDPQQKMLINEQRPHIMNMFQPQNQHMNVMLALDRPADPNMIMNGENSGQDNQLHDQEAAQELINHHDQDHEAADNQDDQEGEQLGSDGNRRKRKIYHRHTPYQIQELENFFKECPRPDEKQRKMLSHQLGLELTQIKFWFQNKRTQNKTHMERHENTLLKEEMDRLRVENTSCKNVMSNIICPDCGGEGVQREMTRLLHLENERLRAQLQAARMGSNSIASGSQLPVRMQGDQVNTSNPLSRGAVVMPRQLASTPTDLQKQMQQQQLQQLQPASIRNNIQIDKNIVWNMAVGAVEEIDKMSQILEPLWIQNSVDSTTYHFNEEEYFRLFPHGFGPRPANRRCEASRHSTVLAMNSLALVEIFLNMTQWKSLFNAIVAKSRSLEIISTGMPGSYDGTLLVISAELHLLSPFVPTRQNVLARYCRHLAEGKWGIADISLDVFRPLHLVKCRRRPSGCIIEQMPNGFSKVTWIEHVEVEDANVHTIYRPFVGSGLAFGAKRWLGILERQTDRLVSSVSQSIPFNDIVVTNMDSKRTMTRLAERMVRNFNAGVSPVVTQPWSVAEYSGPVEARVLMLRNFDQPGRPTGVVLSTTVSFWLPATPIKVFDYLQVLETRTLWDVLANDGKVEEVSRTVVGRDEANCISMLRISKTEMLVLQEANWDPMGAYLIYAPVDVNAINMLITGSGDCDYMALLPSGFAVFPDGPSDGISGGGSLVTLSYQLLVDSCPAADSVQGSALTVVNLINNTMNSLIAYFTNQRGPN